MMIFKLEPVAELFEIMVIQSFGPSVKRTSRLTLQQSECIYLPD